MPKKYLATFELTEKGGDITRSSEDNEIAPLKDMQTAFFTFLQEQGDILSQATIERTAAPKVESLRVSMSRNNGIGTLKTEIEEGQYLFVVSTTVEPVWITDAKIAAGEIVLAEHIEQGTEQLNDVVRDVYRAMRLA